MSRRRFYAAPDAINGSSINLSRDETHHLTRVLRLKPGAEVFLFDGRGKVRLGDSIWAVEGPDTPAGARVTVTGAKGTVLVVERATA